MSKLNLSIVPAKDDDGNSIVLIVSQQGALAQSISFPVSEDVQEALNICDFFYKQLFDAFGAAGRERSAARAAADMLSEGSPA